MAAMPEHRHTDPLLRDELAYVAYDRCGGLLREKSDEEWTTGLDVVFPHRGTFVLHYGRRDAVVADPTRIILYNRLEPYRVSHPIPGGDACTVFSLSDDLLFDLMAMRDPAVRERPDRPFAFHSAPVDGLHVAAQRRLVADLERGRLGACEAQERIIALVAGVIGAALRQRGVSSPGRRGDTRRVHAELVSAVQSLLNRDFQLPLTLEDVARAVHTSPFHLCRIFRRYTALPVHRYLSRLRLRAALEPLADGARDLTSVALDCGFSSHSHFTDAFKREFGTTPSAFRRAVGGEE